MTGFIDVVRPLQTSSTNSVIRIEIIPDAPPNSDCETVQGFAANNNGAMDIVVRVETLHISSSILAIKTPSFSKLFSNQKHVTIRVYESEEAVLKELLNYMCTEPLVMDDILTADDSKLFSRIKQCSKRLQNSPMTPDSALFYLELPHTPLMADALQPLAIAANQYLAARYKDITKFKEEVMALPLSGIEAILACDDLLVDSEDDLVDFVLSWARQHYNNKKERQKVLCSRLAPLIRFPYMTCPNIQKVCHDFDFTHEGTFKLVLEALKFKEETPDFQRQQSSASLDHRRFVERAYKHRPVKVVSFQLPLPECVVYLDLKREECATLFPSGTVYSQAFHLAGQGFFLSAECNQHGSFHCFDLSLGMQKNNCTSLSVDYEFAARSRPTKDFVSKYKGNYTFSGGKIVGHTNFFGIPWNSFIDEDSLFFIDDVFYLRAKLTIKR